MIQNAPLNERDLFEDELLSGEVSDYNSCWLQSADLFSVDNTLQSYNTMPPLTFNSEDIYTKYEDLPEFSQGTDLNEVVKQLQILFQEKSNWKNSFDAIDNLRILNKYLTRELNNIALAFWPNIIESLQSSKAFVARNSMNLVTEMFMNSRHVRLLDEIVTALVPIVLAKVSYEKGAFKDQAQEALKELCANCCYDNTVMVLCSEAHNQDTAIANSAIKTLCQLVNNLGKNVSKLKYETLVYLTKTLASTLEGGKLDSMKKLAGMMCVYISKRYGLQNYELLLKNSNLTQSELTEVVNVIKSDKSFDASKLKAEKANSVSIQTPSINENLNTMVNPDGVFANLIPLIKDPGTTNGLFSKAIPEENNIFVQPNMSFGAMMMGNGPWSGLDTNNYNKF